MTESAITLDIVNSTLLNTNILLTTIIILITPIFILTLKGLVDKWFKL